MEYAVIIEQATDGGLWAYVPDLPGCTTCGDTEDQVRERIREAIALHIESLRLQGEPVPKPTSKAITVRAA